MTTCARGWSTELLRRAKPQSADEVAAPYGADWQADDGNSLAGLMAGAEESQPPPRPGPAASRP